ncbi:MAG: pyridoxal-phosphate dependent enzyme [Intrasporangium sp.]|uniref:pyridoxal-phosphate dependent enzyme n=1 Tax=Intrasporangium sp. TaxID=1925024 RepID=UPI0026480EAB|nr:pyridoxal-phosphate dependent enzyme [Intrasporangium sp.]MDN5794428.1 pyridoxal-phosphate dependent enzyme [Intrasporangium sp.]
MTVVRRLDEFNVPDLFIDLDGVTGDRLLLKCEALNFAGSIKLKTAVGLLDRAELRGQAVPGESLLVESSSGNLGIGLALAAASRGYDFTCVTDLRCNLASISLMRAMGATVDVITTPHPERGLLGARLDRVGAIVRTNPRAVWLNQYTNGANPRAHFDTTGPEILAEFSRVDVVFLGVGTSGTAMGVARYFRRYSPATTLVGVDVAGSVTFGGSPGPRHIPGIGSSVRPPLLDLTILDDVIEVTEVESVAACRSMARGGLVAGGSTGSIVAGARHWLADHPQPCGATLIGVSPDLGERYLSTVFCDDWVLAHFGAESLDPGLGATVPAEATA